MAGLLVRHAVSGAPLESNILALLPQSEQDPVIERALATFSTHMIRRVAFVVGHSSSEVRDELAERIIGRLSQTALFEEVQRSNPEALRDLISLYQPHRYSMPTRSAISLFKDGSAEAFFETRLRALYSPLGDLYTPYLSRDPLLLLPELIHELLATRGALSIENGLPVFEDEGVRYAVIAVELNGDPFTLSVQERFRVFAESLEREIASAHSDSVLKYSGIVRFADAGSQRMRAEASKISTFSLAAIALLMALGFGSLRYLLLAALPVFVGLLCATAVSVTVFERVHLITLGFGASLIGVCIDYAFHYFCDASLLPMPQKDAALARIMPAITLGVLTTVAGYVGLALAPFPGLRQMAVFSAVGLIGAYATVVAWFPLLVSGSRTLRRGVLYHRAERISAVCSRPPVRTLLQGAALLAVVIGVTGWARLEPNDDIRSLQKAPEDLVAQEHFIRARLGLFDPARFIVVRGESAEQLLSRQEELAEALRTVRADGVVGGYEYLARFLPSIAMQKRVRGAVQALLEDGRAVERYLDALGLDRSLREGLERAADADAPPLQPRDWVSHPGSSLFRALWLEPVGNQWIGLVLLSGVADEGKLADAAARIEGTAYVNKIASYNDLLRRYRIESTRKAAVVCVVLVVIVFLHFRGRRGVYAVMPPLLAGLFTVGALGHLGIRFTLFHSVSLLLVLGIGIDYSIFFSERRSAPVSTMLAIALSAVTTILSLGLLVFSDAGLLQAIGVTMLLGVTGAAVFSLLCLPHDYAPAFTGQDAGAIAQDAPRDRAARHTAVSEKELQ